MRNPIPSNPILFVSLIYCNLHNALRAMLSLTWYVVTVSTAGPSLTVHATVALIDLDLGSRFAAGDSNPLEMPRPVSSHSR